MWNPQYPQFLGVNGRFQSKRAKYWKFSNYCFLRVFHPQNWNNINDTKRHTLSRVRVVWAIKRENPSTDLTCTDLCLTCTMYPFAQKPHGRIYTKFGTAIGGRRCNHRQPIRWWSIKGCGFCGGSKFALSHRQSQSPLTQGLRYSHWLVLCVGWLLRL